MPAAGTIQEVGWQRHLDMGRSAPRIIPAGNIGASRKDGYRSLEFGDQLVALSRGIWGKALAGLCVLAFLFWMSNSLQPTVSAGAPVSSPLPAATGSNTDGKIDRKTFEGIMRMASTPQYAPGKLIFDVIDTNHNGQVDQRELVAAGKEWSAMPTSATAATRLAAPLVPVQPLTSPPAAVTPPVSAAPAAAPSAALTTLGECVPVLRVLVLTMARAKSLARLFRSLENAHYDGTCVAVDVWVDVLDGKPADAATIAAISKFSASWPHAGKVTLQLSLIV